ncbi:MAG: SxtJ family membrane protein [Bacteroidota bacterium]
MSAANPVPTRAKQLETILVITAGMIVFFFIFRQVAFLYVALGVATAGLAVPLAAKYIHLGWMGLAKVLGFINSHILLGVIFFLILTPLALLRRAFSRKDSLQLRKKDGESYYTERNHTYEAADLENPW